MFFKLKTVLNIRYFLISVLFLSVLSCTNEDEKWEAYFNEIEEELLITDQDLLKKINQYELNEIPERYRIRYWVNKGKAYSYYTNHKKSTECFYEAYKALNNNTPIETTGEVYANVYRKAKYLESLNTDSLKHVIDSFLTYHKLYNALGKIYSHESMEFPIHDSSLFHYYLQKADKAINLDTSNNYLADKSFHHLWIGNHFRKHYLIDSARQRYLKIQKIVSNNKKVNHCQLTSYKHIMSYLLLSGRLDSALHYIDLVSSKALENNFEAEYIISELTKATVLSKLGESKLAYDILEKTLQNTKDNWKFNSKIKVQLYEILTICYQELDQSDKAHNALDSAILYAQEVAPHGLFQFYLRKADLYLNDEKFDSAYYYINKSDTKNKLAQDYSRYINTILRIEKIKKEKVNKSELDSIKPNLLLISNMPYLPKSHTYQLWAEYFTLAGKENEALEYLKKAYQSPDLTDKKKSTTVLEKIIKLRLSILNDEFLSTNFKTYVNNIDSIDSKETEKLNEYFKNKLELQAKETENLKQIQTLKEKDQQRNLMILYVFFGILLTSVIISFILFRRRVRQKLHLAQLKNQVLRAQLNPHFLSNTIMRIQNTDQEKHAPLLSKLLRHQMELATKEWTTLEDEITFLTRYLDLTSDFGEKFDYKIHLDEHIEQSLIKIPAMLLQPIIENAIEHSLVNKKDDGQINIEITEENNGISVVIKDNGPGLNTEDIAHMKKRSLSIIQDRIKLLKAQGKNANMEFKDSDNGLSVQLHLPILD